MGEPSEGEAAAPGGGRKSEDPQAETQHQGVRSELASHFLPRPLFWQSTMKNWVERLSSYFFKCWRQRSK